MQSGKCAAFLAIEGAEAVREDEGLLEHAYESGVRMISLVWNLPNSLAAPCGSDEGLTEKGRHFFKRAQALGMLVDVSHVSEKGFWDMIGWPKSRSSQVTPIRLPSARTRAI